MKLNRRRTQRLTGVALLMVSSLAAVMSATPAGADQGWDIDRTFADQGTRQLVTGRFSSLATSTVVDSQGRILVTTPLDGCDVRRFTAAGAVDATFGNGGRYLGTAGACPWKLALDAAGRVLVLRRHDDGARSAIRLSTSGGFDTTFGVAGVVSLTQANAWAVRSDGAIVTAGYTPSYDAINVRRYGSTGVLDAAFGVAGVATIVDPVPVGPGVPGAEVTAIDLDSSGRTVLTTSRVAGAMRLTLSGAPDVSFGVAGKATANTLFAGIAVVTLDDGSVVVGGAKIYEFQFALIKFSPSGAWDRTFGADGVLAVTFKELHPAQLVSSATGDLDRLLGLRVGAGGGIEAYGDVVNRVGVAHLRRDGSFDDTFGVGGRAIVTPNDYQPSGPPAVAPDGAVIWIATHVNSGEYVLGRSIPGFEWPPIPSKPASASSAFDADGVLTLSWEPPAGGQPFDGYVYSLVTSGHEGFGGYQAPADRLLTIPPALLASRAPYVFSVRARSIWGQSQATEISFTSPAYGPLHSLAPARLLDTRASSLVGYEGAKPVAGQVVTLVVAGRGGVPTSDVAAVVLNVTATEATDRGYITVWPGGIARPVASNLNVEQAGQTIANLVTTAVGADGTVQLFTQSGAHLIADVAGWYQPDRSFVPIAPKRVLDTRPDSQYGYGGGKPGYGGTVDVRLDRVDAVPPGASAVVMNVTATESEGAGFVVAYPSGSPRPVASALNIERAGQTIANLVTVAPGLDGIVELYDQTSAHLVVDVAGYYLGHSDFHPINPTRLLDTRADSTVAYSGPKPGPGAVVVVPVAGMRGLPAAGIASVALNITATEAGGPGFVTVWSGDGSPPTASNLNVERAGQTIANMVVVPVGADGTVRLYTQAGTHLVVDVTGWSL